MAGVDPDERERGALFRRTPRGLRKLRAVPKSVRNVRQLHNVGKRASRRLDLRLEGAPKSRAPVRQIPG